MSPNPQHIEFPFSTECEIALSEALEWCRQARDTQLRPEHVLLALIADRSPSRQRRTPAAAGHILSGLGVSIEKVTDTLVDELVPASALEAEGEAPEPVLSDAMEALLYEALDRAFDDEGPNGRIWSAHLLAAMLDEPRLKIDLLARLRGADISGNVVIRRWRLEREAIDREMAELDGGAKGAAEVDADDASNEFVTDLTAAARRGDLDPIIGREAEIERVITVLSRRTKNNPVLLGEAGVGKTAIAEAVAQRIAAGKVPARLKHSRVLALTAGRLVAGTTFRGQFEQRVAALIDGLKEAGDDILFIDELHTIVGAGAAGDAGDMANLLKPALARGELRCMGATTLDEYREFIESDAALERRFQPVTVNEPDLESTERILRGIVDRYAAHHDVTYEREALAACVRLADRYLTNRQFPDKAIDLLDEAGARVSAAGRDTVTDTDIAALVAAQVGLPASELVGDGADVDVAEALAAKVVGQSAAIEALAARLASRRAGRRRRIGLTGPLASFLLVGPSGSGKSTTAAALAEAAFAGRLVEIDLASFAEPHSISGLIGAPAGYVGYGERARLVEPLRRNPTQVVLLKHVDAAHPTVRALIADLLRTGQITDTSNRSASYRDAVIICTLTEGAERKNSAPIGFGSRAAADLDAEEQAAAAARAALGPEFVDTFDAVVPFSALDAGALAELRDRKLEALRSELRRAGIRVKLEPAVADAILASASRSGARGMSRAIEHYVERPLAREMASNTNTSLTLALRDGRVVIRNRRVSRRAAARRR